LGRRGGGCSGSFSHVDPDSNQVVARIETDVVTDIAVGAASVLGEEILPGGGGEVAPIIAVGAGGVWAWARNHASSFAAVRIDAQTKQLMGEPVALDRFFPVAVDELGVWFVGSSGERASLSHLDPRTGQVDRSVALGITPIDAALDPARDTAWVADYWPSVVRVDLR
jgi:streptogramin lyase